MPDTSNVHRYKLKEKIYGIIKLIVFLSLLFISLFIVNDIVKRKFPHQKVADFFTQEEDFDVLFYGSSHMINGVFPIDLWNDNGIISYNMATHGERVPTSYYNLILSTKYHKPKLVVVDAFFTINDEKVSPRVEQVHQMLDMYPISYEKYLAIKDIFDGRDMLNKMFEYLFSFSIYHNRWNELNQADFKFQQLYEKGTESRINVAKTNEMNAFIDVEMYSGEETIGMEYLRKIIEYCNQQEIEILIIYLPYPTPDEDIANSKYIQKIANEYNVNYINFLEMNIANLDTDFYDAHSHLNPSGARKVTEYLGKYILENYNIQDQRQNGIYDFWNEDYSEYIDLKINNLKNNRTNLNNYLMLLYDEEDISYEIKISSRVKLDEETTLQKLFENIDNNYEIDDEVFKDNPKANIKITTWDKRNEKLIDTVWF